MNFDVMTFRELYKLCLKVQFELMGRIWWIYPILAVCLIGLALWAWRKK